MKEKVVVVTGSTSGIGHGVALEFARNGAKIVLNGFVDEKQQRALIREMYSHGASDVEFIGSDLTNPHEIEQMFDSIKDKFGKVYPSGMKNTIEWVENILYKSNKIS